MFSGFPQIGVAAGLVLANLVFSAPTCRCRRRFPRLWLAHSVRLELRAGHRRALYPPAHQREPGVPGHARTRPRHHGAAGRPVPPRLDHDHPSNPVDLLPNTLGYITLFFILSYGTQTLHLTRSTLLTFVIVANACEVLMTLYSGALSDRLGRKRTLLLGSGVGIVMGALFFPMVDTAMPVWCSWRS